MPAWPCPPSPISPARTPSARSTSSRVLVDAFDDLIERDPRAFRGKFRKMAADPFAFYRGSAPLFYSDVDRLDDPWVDDATSRVWIQGDLHAENYGTYMDSAGVLVFDVNDFDEAYLGHYTWDLQRMAASLALLGFRKALSDDEHRAADRDLRARLRGHRAAVRDLRGRPRLPADAGQHRRRRCTTCCRSARMETRVQLLDALTAFDGGDRRLAPARACASSTTTSATRCSAAYERVPGHDPRGQAPAEHLLRGQGRRRALRVRDRLAPGCAPTRCSSRGARRRSRTTSCCR